MKRSNVLTTTEFVVNKDLTRGCRHGTARDKFYHYKAKEDKKKARKHDCNSIHERKMLAPSITNLGESVWTAQTVKDMAS